STPKRHPCRERDHGASPPPCVGCSCHPRFLVFGNGKPADRYVGSRQRAPCDAKGTPFGRRIASVDNVLIVAGMGCFFNPDLSSLLCIQLSAHSTQATHSTQAARTAEVVHKDQHSAWPYRHPAGMEGVLHLTYIAALLRAEAGDAAREALPEDIQRL